MYGNDQIITYLQNNRVLAMKLDHATIGVGQLINDQIQSIGAGANRVINYLSCFTDEYYDVCQKQGKEDARFKDAVFKILQGKDVVYEMLKVYFDEVLKHKTNDQLEHIKQWLMEANVHIAASSLTKAGFAMAVASSVRIGLNVSMELSALAGKRAGGLVGALGVYGVIQKAADSAHRLHFQFPAYYAALYSEGLEMLYFLIEPTFIKAHAAEAQWASDRDVIGIIKRMMH